MSDLEPNGHDPKDDQLYGRSFWHRLNQMYAETGGTVVLPEDWARTEAEDNAICVELPYDNDPVARRIASDVMRKHIEACAAPGWRRVVYEGWCPESEATLFALGPCYNSSYVAALRNIEQLREIKKDMKGNWRCDTLVNRHCGSKSGDVNAEYPVEFLAVKRGDHICVFTACHHCMLHISSGAGVDDPDYIGPAEDWYDDRQPWQ
ncbi:hypothetical protein A5791_03420 [Mycobacterium sp. 852002-51163_SCH5372311]|uniref:hypothetical protein n=1 Tax=Mycobacterium sp. 852002-51163_SCH5372311 TaxID=1834097 RepID=UPI0007FD81E1|nr:hypothetical protein [Mycobacterium sp. 852002-51163_SCH5372311]OBF83357.1 hypothetical protein A5791_03420 [Mycobacterium sp. 852002-51163_SCH5372311]